MNTKEVLTLISKGEGIISACAKLYFNDPEEKQLKYIREVHSQIISNPIIAKSYWDLQTIEQIKNFINGKGNKH